jgi:uncharacterized membrane protein
VIILREEDFNDVINYYKKLETKNIDLKSTVKKLKYEIETLEEYNRYLRLEKKVNSKGYKSNFFTQ